MKLALLLLLIVTGCSETPRVPKESGSTKVPPQKVVDNAPEVKSSPHLKIESLSKPENRSLPLDISLELSADGTTAIAVSQQQFTIRIYTDSNPYTFVCEASFPPDSPKIFQVLPGKPLNLKIKSAKNELGQHENWNRLIAGNYKLKVYINSGKHQEFENQWLGQTYSEERQLKIGD